MHKSHVITDSLLIFRNFEITAILNQKTSFETYGPVLKFSSNLFYDNPNRLDLLKSSSIIIFLINMLIIALQMNMRFNIFRMNESRARMTEDKQQQAPGEEAPEDGSTFLSMNCRKRRGIQVLLGGEDDQKLNGFQVNNFGAWTRINVLKLCFLVLLQIILLQVQNIQLLNTCDFIMLLELMFYLCKSNKIDR